MRLKHKNKHYNALMRGEKIPRKAKKAILGNKMSRTKLRQRIDAVRITERIRTIYDGFGLSDAFCLECGCEKYTRSGNRVAYPELWETLYCARCGNEVAEADNSPYYHVLYFLKYDE